MTSDIAKHARISQRNDLTLGHFIHPVTTNFSYLSSLSENQYVVCSQKLNESWDDKNGKKKNCENTL